jgi:PucR C-terminal helix-turn-helix domain
MSFPPHPWEALPATLVEPLSRGVEPTGAEIVAAIRAGVPAYGRPLEGRFGQGLRDGVAAALRQFIGLIAGAADHAALDRRLYRELGAFEFREGRTLDSLLAAYRLGARVAWRRAAAAATDAGHDAETLALLAEAVFAYIDELSAASAEGYAAEQFASVHETERRRAGLLGLLVQRLPAEPAAVERAARAAGWPLPDRLAVLVWAPESRSAALPPDTLRGRAGDLPVAVVPDPDAPGRHAQLAGGLGRATAAIGPSVTWPYAGRSLQRARQALELARRGLLPRRRLLVAGDHLATLLVHADPELAAELAQVRLAPLHDLPGRAGERLAETLRAWLDHHGSAPAAAAALDLHPQTVRHRLRRLRDVLGDELDDPAARFELALALRCAASPQTRRPGPVAASARG